MPHLIIEHSSNFTKKSISKLQTKIQYVMGSCEGNFDPDQCKCRTFSFDEYLVGKIESSDSSFIHITLKALSGRSLEVRKNLAEKIMKLTKDFFDDLKVETQRCDISIDIVEMEREVYQKVRIEK